MRWAGGWLVVCAIGSGCAAGVDGAEGPVVEDDAVNDVLGDESWLAAFGAPPGAAADEVTRIRTHLAHVEALLRSRDDMHLSDDLRAARVRNLDRLHAYWVDGRFPDNTSGAERLPRFVDDDMDGPLASEGAPRLCAVGHLLAADLGVDAALGIARDFEYARVADIDSEVLCAWAGTSGLSLEELATIQPKYGFRPPRPPPEAGRLEPSTVRRLLATREHQVNACIHDRLAARDAHPAQIAAEITVAPDGRVAALELTTGLAGNDLAVQSCIAQAIGAIRFPRSRGEPVTAKHAFAVIGPTTRGRLNPAYLPVVFRRAESEVRACVEASAIDEMGLVELTVLVMAEPTGRFSAVEVLPGGELAAASARCVRRAVHRLELPLFQGGPQRTSHGFRVSL